MTTDTGFTLDTPEGIAHYRIMIITSMLKTEINHTGDIGYLQRPSLNFLIDKYKLPAKKTKADVLEKMEELLTQIREGEAYYEIRDGVCHFEYTQDNG